MRADSAFYLTRLYPMQNGVLARLTSVETGFYLTGGGRRLRARTFIIGSRMTWTFL